MLLSHQVKQLPEASLWRNFELFSLEKSKVNTLFPDSSIAVAWVQLFWSRPLILLAKVLADKIYCVAWRSMLSNVGWSHKGELFGPFRTVSEGGLDNQSPNCLFWLWLLRVQSEVTRAPFKSLVRDHSHTKVWERTDTKGTGPVFMARGMEVALSTANTASRKGNWDHTNEFNGLGYWFTKLPQSLGFVKLKEIAFHAQQPAPAVAITTAISAGQ